MCKFNTYIQKQDSESLLNILKSIMQIYHYFILKIIITYYRNSNGIFIETIE